jgi:hypothetical protein
MNKPYHGRVKAGIMPPMRLDSHRSSPRLLAATVALLAAVALQPAVADAKGKPKYYFELAEVKVKEGVPAELTALVQAEVVKALEADELIVTDLAAAGVTASMDDPKAYKKALKKKKLTAYRVNVEVTAYATEIEQLPAPRKGKRVEVSVSLRMFGEALPDRIMAFTGEGSATIKIDIGAKFRPRDQEAADHDAIELAVGDALATSLAQLSKPKDTPKK